MLRRSRIHLDGVPLHIVQRGHNREPCFFAEDDYSSYLRTGTLWDSRWATSGFTRRSNR